MIILIKQRAAVKTVLRIIFNLLTFTLMILTTVVYSLVFFLLLILLYLIPSKRYRSKTKTKLILPYCSLYYICFLPFKHCLSVTLHPDPAMPTLSLNNTYIMLSNHQSWLDVLVIITFLQSQTSCIKFIMKKELLWQLPFASWFCYMNNYPMIKRQKDIQSFKHDSDAIRVACQAMCSTPSTLMIFPEGRRFSQQKKKNKPTTLEHLLPPKQHGLALSIESIHEHLSGIINVTIIYRPQKTPIKNILLGKTQHIDLYYTLIPADQICKKDPLNPSNYKTAFKSWLNTLWQKKDKLIQEHHQQ